MDPLTQGVLGASLPQAGSAGRYAASAGLLGFWRVWRPIWMY